MKNFIGYVGLTIAVVIIPHQLLSCHKLLAQQRHSYTLERQCQAPMNPAITLTSPETQAAAGEALVACDRALANTPNNSPNLINILANRAFALQTLGRYEEAIATWDRIISIDPQRGFDRANVVRELEIHTQRYPNRPIQIPDSWVKALTEALRLAIANIKQPNYPIYSDWRLPPRAIATFSRVCTKKVVLPEQFAANPTLARSIMECRMRAILTEEYYQSQNNELEAVRRAAAMFNFGIANSSTINSPFVQEVVNNYRHLRSSKH